MLFLKFLFLLKDLSGDGESLMFNNRKWETLTAHLESVRGQSLHLENKMCWLKENIKR